MEQEANRARRLTGSDGVEGGLDLFDLVEVDVVDVAGADQSGAEQRRQNLAAEDDALERLVDGQQTRNVAGHELVVRVHAPQFRVDFGEAQDQTLL